MIVSAGHSRRCLANQTAAGSGETTASGACPERRNGGGEENLSICTTAGIGTGPTTFRRNVPVCVCSVPELRFTSVCTDVDMQSNNFAGEDSSTVAPTIPVCYTHCTHAQAGPAYHRLLESDTVGALAVITSPRPGALSSASSLGKRARGGEDDDDDDNTAGNPRSKVSAGGHRQRHGSDSNNDNRGNLGPNQSPPSPKVSSSASPVPVGGFDEEHGSPVAAGNAMGGSSSSRNARVVSSGKPVAYSKSSLGNPDMAGVLRR